MHVPLTEVILSHRGAELARATFAPGEYIIGREPGVDLHADTPLLSLQHARLTINYDHLLLEDLGSSHGTFINDQPLAEATRLFPNQSIRLGPEIVLEVRRLRASSEPGVSLAPAQAAIARHLPAEMLGEKRYAIGGIIARGGMGAILDARQNAIKRTVAMKVMLENSEEEHVVRFIEEAQVTAQLEHPNIVPVHELGVDEQGQVFYTMKMVHGSTLMEVLSRLAEGSEAVVKKYPLPALLTVFQKVCDALAFAHNRGVIHRDLKPSNIMLGDFGSVLVMDWGLAKILGGAGSHTPHPGEGAPACDQESARAHPSAIVSVRSIEPEISGTMMGLIMGTPAYMSPEQARGENETLDARSDIFALGSILFEILHLRPTFGGYGGCEILEKVQRGEVEWGAPATARAVASGRAGDQTQVAGSAPADPAAAGRGRPAPPTRARALPASLLAICRQALALDPAVRYPSVEALQADLLAYQNGFATSAEKAGAWKQFTLLVKRHKAASIGVAAVLLIGGVLGTKAIVEGNRAKREAVRAERGEQRALRGEAAAKDTLAELSKTAPTFAAMAKGLVEQGNLEGALEKIGYAVSLNGRNADYLLQQANLLQATQQLTAAADGYRAVLALRTDGAAKRNLELCEKLLRDNPGSSELKRESQEALVSAMMKQNRAVEAAPLSQILGKGSDTTLAAIKARMKPLLAITGPDARAYREPNGTFRLELDNRPIVKLPPLDGLPISRVHLGQTKVSDLTPLKGLRLRWLSIGNLPGY